MKTRRISIQKIFKYKERICFFLLLVTFLILSLKTLNFSLWNDEIITVNDYAINGFKGVFFTEKYDPGNQLFFSMILAVLLQIFGFSEFVVRIPSVIFTICTLVVLYRFLWKVFSEKVALLYTVLLLLSTQFWDLCTQARGYALLFLCLSCCIYSVYFEQQTKKTKYSVLFYTSSFVGVATFPLFCLWVGGLFIYRIIVHKKRKVFIDAVVITIACLLFYVPVLGKMIEFFSTSIEKFGVPLKWTEFLFTPLEYLLNIYFDDNVSAIIGLTSLILTIWGGVYLYKRNKVIAKIITIPTVFTLLIMLVLAVNTTTRYLSFLQIIYLFYVLFGVLKIYSICTNWKWKCLYVIIVLIIGIQIVQPLITWQQTHMTYARERFKETCEYILERYSQDAQIVIVSAVPPGWRFYMKMYNFTNYTICMDDTECLELVDSMKENGDVILIDHMAYREQLAKTYELEWPQTVERQLMRGAMFIYEIEEE